MIAMIVLVGVDPAGHYEKAVSFLAALRMYDARAYLVHVVEPNLPMPSPFTLGFVPAIDDFGPRLRAGKDLLDAAVSKLVDVMPVVGTSLTEGYSAQSILSLADEVGADLVVGGTTNIGRLNSMFMGSVSKALINSAHCSVLFAKHPPKSGQLTAVLATDHSPYMNRCIDQLMRLWPDGIGKIIVLTANLLSDDDARELLSHMPALGDASRWVEARLHEKNDEVISQLSTRGVCCESRVESASVREAIERTMKESDADILVLGSQGHGFIDRIRTGSTSFDQVMLTEHSVLLLRAS